MTDAVEKVRGTPSARNNRIVVVNFLNRSCASRLVLNQYCSESPKILFNSIDPLGHGDQLIVTFVPVYQHSEIRLARSGDLRIRSRVSLGVFGADKFPPFVQGAPKCQG